MAHSAFISGQWVSGGGAAMSSTDPATGDTVWTGKSATPDIVKEAFGSSRAETPARLRLRLARA